VFWHKQIGRNKSDYWTVTKAELYAISRQKIFKKAEHTEKTKVKLHVGGGRAFWMRPFWF